MISEYTIRKFSNGAQEIIYTTRHLRKITYNNGDVVYFDRAKLSYNGDDLRGGVVKIITHDGMTIGDYNTLFIDAIVSTTLSSDAAQYERQGRVLSNLNKDSRYYDKLLSALISCRTCGGSGDLTTEEEVGEWENEGGRTYSKPCDCGGVKTKITEDMVKRFFDIELPSRNVKLCVRRSGTIGFDINIAVSQNPAIQDTAMDELEALLKKEKELSVYPAAVNHDVGVSYRHIAGDPKVCQAVLQKWIKTCQQKFGNGYVAIESLLQ